MGTGEESSNPVGPASVESQIDDNVVLGLAAADQYVAIRRRFHRIGSIGDGPGDQPGFAGVANARTT
jgi:hypothetical protein